MLRWPIFYEVYSYTLYNQNTFSCCERNEEGPSYKQTGL